MNTYPSLDSWKATCLASLAVFVNFLYSQEIDWNKPPPPRPNDPRLELQPVFDGNGVVYDWKAYIYNPVSKEKNEIVIDERERQYRVTDSSKTNSWTISLKLYTTSDRPATKPQGARICLKDIQYPPNLEKPHFEFDLSGQITVALTLDCPQKLTPQSVHPTSNTTLKPGYMVNLSGNDAVFAGSKNKLIASLDEECRNCVFVENSSFTHPDRAGGPDVASNSDRTLFAFREIINEIRIYQETSFSPTSERPSGFAYAWQGGRTNPAVSVGLCRHDKENQFGVVFTIPRGFTYPNVEGTIRRLGGISTFLREIDTGGGGGGGSDDDPPPPPVTP